MTLVDYIQLCHGLCASRWIYVTGNWARLAEGVLTIPSAVNSLRGNKSKEESHFNAIPTLFACCIWMALLMTWGKGAGLRMEWRWGKVIQPSSVELPDHLPLGLSSFLPTYVPLTPKIWIFRNSPQYYISTFSWLTWSLRCFQTLAGLQFQTDPTISNPTTPSASKVLHDSLEATSVGITGWSSCLAIGQGSAIPLRGASKQTWCLSSGSAYLIHFNIEKPVTFGAMTGCKTTSKYTVSRYGRFIYSPNWTNQI